MASIDESQARAEAIIRKRLSHLSKRDDWAEDDTAVGGQAAHIVRLLHEAGLFGEEGAGAPLQPPTEPGMLRYAVEVMPHDWANDGTAWEAGTQSPADVARALRSVADQVDYFTPPANGDAA